jgi:hypothetical protein
MSTSNKGGGGSIYNNKKVRLYASFCVGVFLVRGCSVGICPLGAQQATRQPDKMAPKNEHLRRVGGVVN